VVAFLCRHCPCVVHTQDALAAADVGEASDEGTDADGGTGRGLGPEADLPVAGADLIEIRRVVSSPDEEPQDADADQLPTTFGRYAVPVDVLTEADNGFEGLVTAMSEARYIDTCGVTFDLSDPVYEAVFFDGGEELAHLGYYEELAPWGNCNVPGRWMDEDRGLTDRQHAERAGQARLPGRFRCCPVLRRLCGVARAPADKGRRNAR
jgi:hypothetical protein